jgi:hypothetical protein
MKKNIEQLESETFDRLAAAKPQSAEARSEDFIAAAIEQSDALAARAPRPRRRPTRSLMLASAAGALTVVALTATSSHWMGTQAGHGPLFKSLRQLNSSASNIQTSLMSPQNIFRFEPGAGFSDAGSTGPVYVEVPVSDPMNVASKLFELVGENIETASKKEYFDGETRYVIDKTPDSMSPSSVALTLYASKVRSSFIFGVSQGDQAQPLPSSTEAENTVASFMQSIGFRTTSGDVVPDGTYRIEKLASRPTNMRTDTPGINGNADDLEVAATLYANGLPTAVALTFHWSANDGQLATVNGNLATLEMKGTYDTVSEKAAIERISQPFQETAWSGLKRIQWSKSTYWAMDESLFLEISDCTGFTLGNHTPAPCHYPFGELDGKKMPILTDTATEARPATMEIVSSNGTRWLVPGFDYFDESGYLGAGQSLADGLVADVNHSVLTFQPTN